MRDGDWIFLYNDIGSDSSLVGCVSLTEEEVGSTMSLDFEGKNKECKFILIVLFIFFFQFLKCLDQLVIDH